MKKILIIAGGLHMGGAEKIAANISRYAPEGEYEFHYIVFEGYDNVYGPEIEERGGKVITLPSPGDSYIRYIKNLGELMKKNRYAAVHSHTMFSSAFPVVLAKLYGIPVRITHSHTTKTEHKVSAVQEAYQAVMRYLIRAASTDYLACGQEAGYWLFGRKAFQKKGRVIYNGVDTKAYAFSGENRERIRDALGLSDAFIIGHSGTISDLKNQAFLVSLMPDILKVRSNAVLMLLGNDESGLGEELKRKAEELGIDKHVIFTGPVMNVQEYLSAMDVFAFPSKREGTPLALLEAQANGLPCIVSARIPSDAFLTELVTPADLDEREDWVRLISGAERKDAADYAGKVKMAGYDAAASYDIIYDIYRRGTEWKAMVSLSFDDGRGDNYKAFRKITIPHGIPVTLNVTTGYVEGSCPPELIPTEINALTRQQVEELAKSPLVEIALHGDNHQNTREDVSAGRDKLSAWTGLKEGGKWGFASPGSGQSVEEFINSKDEFYTDDILYLRTGMRVQSLALLRALCRKAGRVIHLPVLYRIAYADTIMHSCPDRVIYSVPVMKDITYLQVKSLVNAAIRSKGAVTLMFHSIMPDSASHDSWSWDTEKFRKLCAYLAAARKKDALDILTTEDLYSRLCTNSASRGAQRR